MTTHKGHFTAVENKNKKTMIDFKQKLQETKVEKPLSPIEIYNKLDRSAAASGPLRKIQEDVLSEWYKNRFDDRDIIVKLHTGQGKTLIGLLMLQAKLNADKGPCLFVCPNIQLAQQVALDATKFGINYCFLGQGDTIIPTDFIDGKTILITYVQKVFNGRSIFGLDMDGENVGTFLLDDSHACIDSIKNAFSMRIERQSPLFKIFLEMFKGSLTEQGEGDYYKILGSESCSSIMVIPYWDWIRKKGEVVKKLIDNEDLNLNIKFTLPIIQNILEYCTMYVTGNRIEITPDYMPIERFTSFYNAKTRILMSATTQDDSFFIRGFDFSKEAILTPLTCSMNEWSGEKMILFPTIISEDLNALSIREMMMRHVDNRKFGIVSLVPSFRIAVELYRNMIIPQSQQMNDVLKYLSSGTCPDMVVFVNRYDGVDLADNKCRVLILDSLPMFDCLSDRYDGKCRQGNKLTEIKIAQKIEQGLGRSVRSQTDYSVIIILGEDLVRFMKTSRTQKYFSAQTKAQISIGENVTTMIREEAAITDSRKAFVETIKQCINRDEGWKAFYQETMNKTIVNAAADEKESAIEHIIVENEIDKALKSHNVRGAKRKIQKLIDCATDDKDKGWYQQLLAKYTFLESEIDAEKIQYEAHFNNPYLLKPEKFPYKKIGVVNTSRLQLIKNGLERFETYLDLKLYVEELCSNLVFAIASEKFEEAVKNMGEYLGFESQRPDLEYKTGPDNLWHFGNGTFFLIECKNEVELDRKEISKSEVGQMSNHIHWFKSHYPDSKICANIWIHPTNKISPLANLGEKAYAITPGKLNILRKAILKYTSEFQDVDLTSISDEFIQKLIKQYKFEERSFVNTYLEECK